MVISGYQNVSRVLASSNTEIAQYSAAKTTFIQSKCYTSFLRDTKRKA